MKGFQLSFPFIDKFPQNVTADGILTSKRFLEQYGNKEKYDLIKKTDLKKLIHENEEVLGLMGKLCEEYIDGKYVKKIIPGKISLTKHAANNYYIENFMPTEWLHSSEQIKDDRRIYRVKILSRKGKESFMMAKSPKILRGHPVSDDIYNFSRFTPMETSINEFETITKLKNSGVNVETPLGYFVQGNEQWLYTKFVNGISPLEALADNNLRKKVWESDAILLAGLCKKNMKYQFFYKSSFDDKIWDGKIVLIDGDLILDMKNRPLFEDHYKLHPENLPDYHIEWLKDCISEYKFSKLMSETEAIQYAKTFLDEINYAANPKELVKTIAKNRMSEETYISMMHD